MIHVCRLDVGSRHVFDSADGINEVGSLSSAIEHYFNIDKQKQILLISGGEILNDNTQKLYRLSAGREESPIYLIDQTNVEKDHPPTVDMPLDSLTQDMRREIEAAILLKPSFSTMQTRLHLSTKVYELGKKLHDLCQSFYDDQYWQYQGFLALIANLDEFFNSFCKRKDVINEQFEKYLNTRDYNKDLMKDIDKYIELLSNIRILPQIMSQINSDNKSTSESTTDNSKSTSPASAVLSSASPSPNENLFGNNFSSQSIADLQALQINETQLKLNTDSSSSNLTLLEWIKSTDPQNKLNSVIDETREMLSHFDSNFKWELLQNKINKLVDQIENNPQMREIEGLTKRLQDLNNFLEMSKKFLSGQQDIVESLNANYERASKLKDESVLEDLCMGHEKQLEVFKSNHEQMIEITRKISKAKLELVRVIHSRLNWVMQIQKQLADHDFQLQIYFKQLKRIGARIKLIDMIKKAPGIYMCSIKETIRRQSFSDIYKNFAVLLGNLTTRVFDNEMLKRQAFDKKINCPYQQHFILNILFQGLSDKVTPLITDTSLNFDKQLPNLKESEVLTIENDIISHLSSLRASSFDSSSTTTSSSSTSAISSSASSGQQMENSSPMFESPQNSATKPSETTNSSSSSKSSSNKLTKFSETFLANLNLEEYKTDICGDVDMSMLHSLSVMLLGEEKSKASNGSNNAEESSLNISEIRVKLNEARSVLKSFTDEFKNDTLAILNKQSDLEKYFQNTADTSKQVKTNFYSDFLAFIKTGQNNATDFQSKNPTFSEEDNTFAKKLQEHLVASEESGRKQIVDLQAALNLAKKNMNADKQKVFNEAIKRATQEKEKVIEELRLKETGYLAKIEELQEGLKNALDYKSSESLIVKQSISLEKEDNLPVIPETEFTDLDEDESKIILNSTASSNEVDDITKTKIKLRELMLMEKISQLEKQLALFTTLPVTNDYETIQLNSCNIDDLVIAVYSEEYGSYKIIHKSSSYLHFVHSAIFKSYEQRLSFKTNLMKTSQLATSPISDSALTLLNIESSQSELQFSNPSDISFQSSSFSAVTGGSGVGIPISHSNPTALSISTIDNHNFEVGSNSHSPIVKNSPSDNIQSIFLAEKQPQWFVGRVLVKEFCIARKENNRFRVPSGTRFYRVKLKPHNL